VKKNLKTYISLILIVISAAAIIVFDVCNFVYTDDDILNSLLDGIIPRLIAGGALIGVSILLDYKQSLTPSLKQLPFHLLWCIPCFLVVFANFPLTALITGSAQILRSDLIALFLLKEPVVQIINNLKELILFAPKEEVMEQIRQAVEENIRQSDYVLAFLDVIQTGRKTWVEIYVRSRNDLISVKEFKQIQRNVSRQLGELFDQIYVEIIPEIEKNENTF